MEKININEQSEQPKQPAEKKPVLAAQLPDTGEQVHDKDVEYCVWDLNSISKIISAASVTWTRKNSILECVFRDKRKKVVWRGDACQFTQRPVQPIGML